VHCITLSSARQLARSASRAGLGALLITLTLASSLSFAQQGPTQGTPNVDSPRQSGGGGGGVGIGINIDVGSVINLLRDRNKKDQKCDPEVEQGARAQFQLAPMPGLTMDQFVLKACEQHTAANLQRKTVISTLSAQRSTQKGTPQGASCKVNGSFETGDFSSWTGANNGTSRSKASLALITTLGISSGAINLDTSHQTIVTAGNDPTVGALLQQVRPGGGTSAARIGNTFREPSWFSGYGAELLAKSFRVTAADAIVGFSYAVVLNDGGASHKPGGTAINPRFMVRVLDSGGTDITNNIAGGRVRLTSGATPNILEADVNNPFFKSFTMPSYSPVGRPEIVTPKVAYKDWSCSEINLSDLVGQDVTIEFITQDCDASGHFAYAYVDDFCTTCGPGAEGAIQLAEADKCGVGKVCVDVTVPKTGTQTGQATASLDIWRNGVKLTTYTGAALNADGKICFPIDPNTIPGLDKTKGFDYSAKADFKIGSYVLPTKLLGAGPEGLQPGRNNDYTPTCSTQGGTCGQPGQPPCPICGQAGQPPCPACGQPGQPLCEDSCKAADYANPAQTPNSSGSSSSGLSGLLGGLRNAARGEGGKPPALQKKALATGSGANGNYTVSWVVSYANTSNQALNNVIVRDGPIATITPGSLQQPTGWTGATNSNAPANNYAQWTGALVPPHGVMTQTLPAPMPKSMSFSGSGDGYQPIPYARIAPPAGQRIYIMNHHLAPGNLLFKCFDVTAGTDCQGWASGKTLPMGDNILGHSSGTMTNNSEYIIDNGKFYYAVMGTVPSDGLGIGCYDLENDTQCGYTKLDNRAPGVHINGPWRVGNELYVASYDGLLYCAKLSPSMPVCQGSSYQIPASTIKLNITSLTADNWNYSLLAGKVVGTKLYLTSLKSAQKYTNCYDTVTKNTCWATTTPTKGTAPYSHGQMRGNYTNYLYYNTSLVPVAICSQINDPAGQYCVNLTTGASYAAAPLAWDSNAPVAGLEAHYKGKTYFINTNDTTSNQAFCRDWATASSCTTTSAGKGAIATPPQAGPNNYGANVDEQGCVWVYGHNGVLWNFDPSKIDPATGLAQSCGNEPGKGQIVFQPLQYCSGPKPFKWTGVEVKSATLANFDKMIVKVLDSTNNTVLFTKDLKASGSLVSSITGINAQTESKPLKVEIEYTPKAGTNDKPYVEVRYDAPPLEFCFTSTHTCQQGNIINKVETQDPLDLNKIISATATANKPQDCACLACGTASTAACPPCGQPGQPPCAKCGQPGQSTCPVGDCIPGTPNCPCIPGTPNCPVIIISGGGCIPGTPGCLPRPPVTRDPVCLTGDCSAAKPQQSVAEEYKEPKVSCVRKPKPVEEPKKAAAPKPRPKPVVVAPPVAVDPNAPPPPPKPKPKPRPKPAQAKPAAHDDDDCE
jgi:hypothetical protein